MFFYVVIMFSTKFLETLVSPRTSYNSLTFVRTNDSSLMIHNSQLSTNAINKLVTNMLLFTQLSQYKNNFKNIWMFSNRIVFESHSPTQTLDPKYTQLQKRQLIYSNLPGPLHNDKGALISGTSFRRLLLALKPTPWPSSAHVLMFHYITD